MSKSETNICSSKQRTDTFYCTIRPLAVLSKFFGAFPLGNTLKDDGRKVTFSYFALIHLWNIALCGMTVIQFMYSCSALVQDTLSDTSDLAVWITFTCYVTVLRTIVEFALLSFYSSRIPALLQNLEDYHQGIGSSLIKNFKSSWVIRLVPVTKIIIILLIMQSLSYYYFKQLNGLTGGVWSVAFCYMYANMWRELPMHMFQMFIGYLKDRYYEIRNGIRELRNDREGKDIILRFETLRLQHAALAKTKEQLEACYGMQIAVNIMFLVIDVVLQLFIFFVITATSNYVLMLLSFYFFCMSVLLIAWVERLRRADGKISQEIAEFELYHTSQELHMQVQLFTTQIIVHPAIISASGFFNLNNALLSSLMGAVATYIVLLVQFTPYFEMYLANITLPSFDFLIFR